MSLSNRQESRLAEGIIDLVRELEPGDVFDTDDLKKWAEDNYFVPQKDLDEMSEQSAEFEEQARDLAEQVKDLEAKIAELKSENAAMQSHGMQDV